MGRPERGVPAPNAVYRFAARTAFTVMDLQRWRFDVTGFKHIPARGGAVIAANHTSFWDYFTVGRPGYETYGRPLRILAKESLFRAPVFGWLMRQTEHIPVHRGAGRDALDSAVAALERGELVLVLPEQTISRSFELLPFKTGAARMAIRAEVPLIPSVSWGTHRFHTAGRWPRPVWKLPVSVRYGPPLRPASGDDPVEVTAALRRRVSVLLDAAIAQYPERPEPGHDWWLPERFGGSAPSPDEARRIADRLAGTWRERRHQRRVS